MFASKTAAAQGKKPATVATPARTRNIQKNPTIGKEDDALEREADRIADKVIQMPASEAANNAVGAQINPVSVPPENSDRNLQSPIVHSEISGAGQALDPHTRSFFEDRLGYDFSRVRVHADQGAAESARLEHSRAYTEGSHIVFGAGEFAPRTTEGKRLLGHELAHVIQQTAGTKAGGSTSASKPAGAAADGPRLDACPAMHGPGVVGEQGGLLRPLGQGRAVPGVIQRKVDPSSDEQTKVDETISTQSNDSVDQAAETAVKVTQLNYVFVFPHDAYGDDAKRYVRTFYPHHRLVETRSLEEMVDCMWRDTSLASETNRFRIRQIIIVTHGNAAGGMTSVSLVPGGKAKFSPPDILRLQQEFRDGLHMRFQEHRIEVISRAIDENTRIEIKGCRIGQSEEALDALRSFMGGEATVTAPTTYQGFEVVKVPGPVFKDKDTAYDTLIASHIDLPEKLVCRADETKAACLDRNFPDGQIPAQFFVTSDEGREKFKSIQAKLQRGKESLGQAEVEAEPLKHREESAADERSSVPSALGQVSEEDALSLAEIEAAAKGILANYRPEQAYVLVSLRRAWVRKKLSEPMSSSPDPIEGLPPESIFGDPNIVGPDASRYPGPTTAIDRFATDVPTAPVEVSPEQRAAYAEDETSSVEGPARLGATRTTGPAVVTLPPDKIAPESKMPRPALAVDVAPSGVRKAETALVLRGDFTRTFEIKYERQLGYLKVKKATVDLNGKIDFRGEGEKEIVLSAFGALASKPGETLNTGGVKGETTLAKGKDERSGVSGKVTGGLSIGGQERTKEGAEAPSTQRGMKAQLYLNTQVTWGPIAHELKLIIVGIDETKQGTDMWTVLGVDWSPIEVVGALDLPVSDGTKVRFTGTIRLTISAEPDWAKIAARLSQALGRQVATEGALVAGGTAAAAGVGAGEAAGAVGTGITMGELVVVGAWVAAAALVGYASYKTAQDIEDLKELQRASDQGVADFCGGYLAYLGITGAGQPGGGLWKEGERHAEINLKARVARAARALNEKHQLDFSDNDQSCARPSSMESRQMPEAGV